VAPNSLSPSIIASYRERVEILKGVPGIGTLAAMELLLELQDVTRFRQADQLAAYVGLTPSQYSSADKVRIGRITKVGKHSLRALLVHAARQLTDQGYQQRAQNPDRNIQRNPKFEKILELVGADIFQFQPIFEGLHRWPCSIATRPQPSQTYCIADNLSLHT
jgi:hypothetical protein